MATATKEPKKRIKTAKVPKAPKAAKTSVVLLKKDCVYEVGDKIVTEDMKLSPQERAIISILQKNGPTTRENLLELMKDGVKTTQPVVKILSFYQSKLVKEGLLKFQHPHRD